MTPDSSKYLITLSDMKDYLAIDNTDSDDDIGYFITVVSEMAETYTGRDFLEDEHTEWHDGSGSGALMLRNYPVSSVHSLVIDYVGPDTTEEIASDKYRLMADEGIVCYQYEFPRGKRNIKAVYTAGYIRENIPYDLRLSIMEMVAQLWQRKNEKLWAHESRQGGEKTITPLQQMPYTVRKVWDRYRRWL